MFGNSQLIRFFIAQYFWRGGKEEREDILCGCFTLIAKAFVC